MATVALALFFMPSEEMPAAQEIEGETEAKTIVQTEATDDASDKPEEQVVSAEGNEKEEPTSEAPPAPAMPDFKASQILPMVVMLGLQKFDLEKMGYTRYVEIAYVIVQLVCFAAIYYVRTIIEKQDDAGKKIVIPEVKQFGTVVTPATEQTPKEYDMSKWNEQFKQAGMGAVILGGVYCKWGYLMPLVLQVLMTPCQLYESPLFQIHVSGKSVTRPFATPSPFGLPTAPAAPAAEAPAAEDKKKEE